MENSDSVSGPGSCKNHVYWLRM